MLAKPTTPPSFFHKDGQGREGGGEEADVGTRGKWRARNEMGSSFGSISALIEKNSGQTTRSSN